jgi:hypothetical protein
LFLSRVDHHRANPFDYTGWGFLNVMLPDTDDVPTLTPEQSAYAPISGFVAFELLGPIAGVGSRSPVAFRAAVPITAVNKYDDSGPVEDEVGLAGKIARAQLPAGNPCTDHSEPNRLFCRLISPRSNRGHVPRALLRGEPIHYPRV